jgi:cardiolipin synthase
VLAALAGLLLVLAGLPLAVAMLLPAGAWLALCAWVWVELGLVRHPTTGLPGRAIGAANFLTLYRGWAAVPVLLLGLSQAGPGPLWFAACLTAGLTDLLDGTVAQRLHQESRLGRLLDPVMDACFFSAAALSLAHWGLMPAWLAGLVAVRYFLPVFGGLGLMLARGRTLPVRHTPWGRISTFAISLALTATWVSSLVQVPAPLLLAFYLVALASMVGAVTGIVRQAPGISDPA